MNDKYSYGMENNKSHISFWSTISFSSFAMFVKICCSFMVAKIIAVYAGAATFGLFGQFISFVSFVQLGSGGVLGSGVSKYVSMFHYDKEKLINIVSSSLNFSFFSSLVLGLLICLLSGELSSVVFHNKSYNWLFIIFGIFLFGNSVGAIILSIFSGLNLMKDYTIVIVSGAFASLALIGVLAFCYHSKGALIGYIFSQFVVCLVAYIRLMRNSNCYFNYRKKIDFSFLKKIFKFSSMSCVSIITLPLVQMVLRSYVANHVGWKDVGYWQGMLKISDAYLLIITTAISTYALPSYARQLDKKQLTNNVVSVLIKLVPLTIVISGLVYLFRKEAIIFLFDKKFMPMEPLFLYQLAGDVVKIASWIVINAIIVREKIVAFIVVECLAIVGYMLLTILMFNYNGLVGITQAFFINYCIYFFMALFCLVRMKEF